MSFHCNYVLTSYGLCLNVGFPTCRKGDDSALIPVDLSELGLLRELHERPAEVTVC